MQKNVFVALVASAVLILDQVTKVYIRDTLGLYESIPIFDSFFHITHARNTGGAFSLFADVTASVRVPFFLGVAVVAVVALFYFLRQVSEQDRLLQFALAGILGGAVGNFIDRLLLGSVTDFLDLHYGAWTWPTFNVADSFISIGMVVLLLHSFFASDLPQEEGR